VSVGFRVITDRTHIGGGDTARRAETLGRVARSLIAPIVGAVTAMLVLAEVGVSLAPILGAAGVVGLAIGFGAQSLVSLTRGETFVEAGNPKGLMWGTLACFVLTLAILLAMSHARALVETRRHSRRWNACARLPSRPRHRVSRRTSLLEEFGRLYARLVQLQQANRQALHQDVNSIAATIGEPDERLAQGTSVRPS